MHKSLETQATNEEQAGNWTEVTHLRQTIATAAPGDADNIAKLAFALRQLRRFDTADTILEAAMQRIANHEGLVVSYAFCAHERGHIEEAVRRWDAALAVRPDHLYAGCCRTAALTALKRFDEAEASATTLLMYHPDNAQAHSVSARIAHDRLDWAVAAERWQATLSLAPSDIGAACCLVTVLTRLERFAEAEAAGAAIAARIQPNIELLRVRAQNASAAEWSEAAELWQQVADAAPHDAQSFSALAAALRRNGQTAQADAALARAMELAPDNIHFQIAYAIAAHEDGDHAEAGRRWNSLRAKYADDLPTLGSIGFHQMQAQLRNLDTRSTLLPDGSIAQEADPVTRRREMFLSMESIGDNCEFGGVQRKFGAEPLGLLRFASISVPDLICALEQRFEGMGSPETVRLEIIQSKEYIIHDAFNVSMHSFIHTYEIPHDRFLAQILRRTAFLQRKLISDLEEGAKLFVYKDRSGMSRADAERLHQAMRRYGRPHLLCVLLADAQYPAGFVQRIDDDFYLGYISRFAEAEGMADMEVDEWLTVCEQVDALRRLH